MKITLSLSDDKETMTLVSFSYTPGGFTKLQREALAIVHSDGAFEANSARWRTSCKYDHALFPVIVAQIRSLGIEVELG